LEKSNQASIYVAFRFHVNFYHSYRGDTPDENGIGKDIRIIRYILDTLDSRNACGVPAMGTWDIENYYSLEKLMRKHCPELIERIRQRAASGVDEIEIMSYNNGLVSAHTEEEFFKMMELTRHNPEGSGLSDIFGEFAPIVRSQECMMTPALVPLYKKAGVEAITMFYSAIPFNGFSNFVPLLPLEKRYNPLWYRAPGREEKIILMPCINPADMYDNLGLSMMIRSLRRGQLKLKEPTDLLLTIDMDADDLFWEGYLNTAVSYDLLKRKTPLIKGGLNLFINKLKDIPYVKFTTPYRYLKEHPPAGEAVFGQDTMDGCFDGFAPWSDKLENAKLWTPIERSRLLVEYARAAAPGESTEKAVAEALKNRVLTLSTTHFGLSTPVMCKPRLIQAYHKALTALTDSERILKEALQNKKDGVYFQKKYLRNTPKQGLIRINRDDKTPIAEINENNTAVFSRNVFGRAESDIIYSGSDDYISVEDAAQAVKAPSALAAGKDFIKNGRIELKVENGEPVLYLDGKRKSSAGSFRTSLNYGGVVYSGRSEYACKLIEGKAAIMTENGAIKFGEELEHTAEYSKQYMIAGELPYIYADVDVSYPMTPDFGVKPKKAARLRRGYDLRWREVMPLELIPSFRGSEKAPVRVIKHNFFGDVSYFDYDYGKFSKNAEFDSSNNALTAGFVAFSAGGEGVLLAQSAAADNKFSFCPVRMRKEKGADKLFLNPFGAYFGKQLDYAAAKTGLAMKMTLAQAEQFLPSASSYRGGRQQFSLMIAPFSGELSDSLINDALLHAYPPLVLANGQNATVGFTDWFNAEPLDASQLSEEDAKLLSELNGLSSK
jgi:hypothetical protein